MALWEVDALCTLGGGSVFTLGADVLLCLGDRRGDTLGGGVFSLSVSSLVAVSKISASCHSAAVCCSDRLIGASLCLSSNVLIRSCAASRIVLPGLIWGSLQWAG